jgi:hypothetical protein
VAPELDVSTLEVRRTGKKRGPNCDIMFKLKTQTGIVLAGVEKFIVSNKVTAEPIPKVRYYSH